MWDLQQQQLVLCWATMAAGSDVVFSGNLMDPEAWDDTALVVAYERAITSFRSVSMKVRVCEGPLFVILGVVSFQWVKGERERGGGRGERT